MNSKIIGFTISRKVIDHLDVDFFQRGIKMKKIKHGDFHVYYWGIGDLSRCFVSKNCFSLSFPLTSSLLDRNVNVRFLKDKIVIENDWLGSIPIFYNCQSGTVSTLMNKVLEANRELDSEGFNNYLDFGFSVFEQTPIKNVKFMRYYSKLTITKSSLQLKTKRDVAFSNHNHDSTVAITNLAKYIQSKERKVEGKIVIPTSGGYDSRLLNKLVSNKERIRAYTYGVSSKQEESSEVIKAQRVTQLLGIKWKRIPLSKYNKYFNEWFSLYGAAVHLHGMYHIEFYRKVVGDLKGSEVTLLSGFFGDVWSGNVNVPKIKNFKDISLLGYTHGLRLDPKFSLLKNNDQLYKKFWKENKRKLSHPNMRIVTAIRLKIILISYLISLPDYFGIPGWTPFLNFGVVQDILSIKKSQWQERKWLREYFKSEGIFVENQSLKFDSDNCLEYEGLKLHQLENIDPTILEEYMDRDFLDNLKIQYDRLVTYASIRANPLSVRFKKVYYLIQKSPYYFMKWYTYITILKSVELTLRK